MKYFSKFYGYCIFILFGIYLNMCVIFRPQDDIYRYVEGYNRLLSGTDWLGKIDLYYWGSAMLFSYFNLSAIYVYIFWSIIYFTAMYLCLRELIKYINNNIISILIIPHILLCKIYLYICISEIIDPMCICSHRIYRFPGCLGS